MSKKIETKKAVKEFANEIIRYRNWFDNDWKRWQRLEVRLNKMEELINDLDDKNSLKIHSLSEEIKNLRQDKRRYKK